MERRLLLHEKLKQTKLNKMTIKQGGANITLNIKADIIDPNVEISEKVLFMLEAYADKQKQLKSGMEEKREQASSNTQQSQNDCKLNEASDENSSRNIFQAKNVDDENRTESNIEQPTNETKSKLDEREEKVTKKQEESSKSLKSQNEAILSLEKLPISVVTEEKLNSSPAKRVCFELNVDFTPAKSKTIKSILKNWSSEQLKVSSPPISQTNSAEIQAHTNASPSENSLSANTKPKASKRRIEDYFIKLPKEKVQKISPGVLTEPTSKNLSPDEIICPAVDAEMVDEKPIDSSDSSIAEENNQVDKSVEQETNPNEAKNGNHENKKEESNDCDRAEVEKSQDESEQKIVEESSVLADPVTQVDNSATDSTEIGRESSEESRGESDESIEPKLSNTSQKPAETGVKSLFSCRLCRMKLGNQRSLFEHVARVHGGKSGTLNLTQMTRSNEDNSDLELENDEDDEKSGEETKPGMSHAKKNKLAPYPNLAIRVAKVAYYTTKSTPNLKTSSIFANGGIRGNFFSQERLQLRSCRIKMKLNSPEKESSRVDQFLSLSNVASEFKPIDRNTSSMVKVSREDASHSVPDEAEVKSFFKSLLAYIPINSVTRVEDLAKMNEARLNADELILVHQIILDSKQFGITLARLKKSFEEKKKAQIKFGELVKLLEVLVENYLAIAVGVVHRVYVAHEFKKHWVIQSVKNQKGRGFKEDGGGGEEASDESDELEAEVVEVREQEKKRRVSPRKKVAETESAPVKNFKPVCLVPRPWRYIDGLLNRPVLQKMLESVIMFLKNKPNSSLESICSHFSPFLQPIMSMELLEMLERLKCVERVSLRKEEECDLFSDFTNGSRRLPADSDEMSGDEAHSFACTKNSIFIIRQVFPN